MKKNVFASIWLHGIIGIMLSAVIYYFVIGVFLGVTLTPVMVLSNITLVFAGYLTCFLTFRIFPEKYETGKEHMLIWAIPALFLCASIFISALNAL